MNNRSFAPKRIVVALLAAGVLTGTAASAYEAGQGAAPAVPTVTVPATAPSATTSSSSAVPLALPDFSAIVSRYGAAVVNVSVVGTTRAAVESPDGSAGPGAPVDPSDPRLNDPFYQFFRRFEGPNGPIPVPREMPIRGEGSGFIVDPNGIILTNAHVVRDANEVTVKLTDHREFRAKVLGSDPVTDVAVLKIDAKNLPTVPLGKIGDVKVGDWVLAIGAPFGFENSATAGIVSAKGRSLPDESSVPFIQTDVAVNPGNSGGPLFNTRGEVVGINSQIFSHTGGYQGLSFAIPIDVAVRVKDQIAETGHVRHARLGVTVQEVNQTLAESFGLARPEGALVSDVIKGSAADKAGLKSGDIIVGLDNHPIVDSGDLPAMIGAAKPGEKVTLDVWRQGQKHEMVANLGSIEEKAAAASNADNAADAKLGLALRPLQPQESREVGISGGLLIGEASGASALAGVQPGDVLIAINGTPVKSVEQVRETVAKSINSSKSVALLIRRGNDTIFVPIHVG